MKNKDEHFSSNLVSFIRKNFQALRVTAGFLVIIFLVLIILFDTVVRKKHERKLKQIEKQRTESQSSQKEPEDEEDFTPFHLGERTVELLLHFVPLLLIFIFIDPLAEAIGDIRVKKIFEPVEASIEDIHTKHQEQFVRIEERLNQGQKYLRALAEYPFFDKIVPSYDLLNWKEILQDAREIDLCLFYTNTTFNSQWIQEFGAFFRNGGKLNLYLPNPLKISDQFFDASEIKREKAERILDTARHFWDCAIKEGKESSLTVEFPDKGFNYMYGYIKYEKSNPVFLFSPYQNEAAPHLPPVIFFNMAKATAPITSFVEKEIQGIQAKTLVPDFEREKLLIWEPNRNRVFVSSSLGCSMGCPFCYIKSIQPNKFESDNVYLGQQLAKAIVTDSRFTHGGEKGTVVLLGGFTDPFLPANLSNTFTILRALHKFGNYVHIATRQSLTEPDKLDLLSSFGDNVIINFSFSSLDAKLEASPGRIEGRFKTIQKMSSQGIKTALYIRPVLPGITLRDTDELISRAKDAGIVDVVIGGLYVDSSIRQSLQAKGLDLKSMDIRGDKDFVLDDKKILKKLNNNDIEEVKRKFVENGFHPLDTSMELITRHRKHKMDLHGHS